MNRSFARFSHIKQCIYDTGSSVDDHMLASYMAATVAIVQAQFTQRRFEDGMQVRLQICIWFFIKLIRVQPI